MFYGIEVNVGKGLSRKDPRNVLPEIVQQKNAISAREAAMPMPDRG